MKMNNTEDFENYLLNKEYSNSTIEEHTRNIGLLNQWQTENNFINEALTYNELLSYVSYLQSRTLKPQSINIKLQSITLYYEYLKEYNYINNNPAKSLRIKGTVKTIVTGVLSYEELQNLYQAYIKMKSEKMLINKSTAQRNYVFSKHTVLLGLFIYQGLTTGEIGQLQIKDIDLYKCVIYVPGAKRRNARILKLESLQILPLSTYLAMLKPTEEKLFRGNAVNLVFGVVQEIKGINQTIRNINHVRASVIMYWLKIYDKRKTQYLIGHRYISSTEKYEEQNVDGLTDLLKKHHPFG
jgi:integrase/recombinase XerD